jgi:hypothetical protein
MATRKAAAAPEPVDDGLVDIAEEIFKDEKIDTNWAEGGLVVRISRIIESLPDMQPKGDNKHFGYRFITDKQVLGVLRPRLSRARIIIVPETIEEIENQILTTAKGGTSYMSRIRVTWRVMDGINGESFTGQSLGYGDDSGDKGANKAFTAALKNFLLKLFQIGGDSDDLEADAETDKRAAARESGSRRVDRADIGDASVGDVERGGKAKNATEAQITRVGQYARDLKLDAPALGAVIFNVLDMTITFGEEPWQDIRAFLEGLTGTQIGKLIRALDDLSSAVDDEPSPLGY